MFLLEERGRGRWTAATAATGGWAARQELPLTAPQVEELVGDQWVGSYHVSSHSILRRTGTRGLCHGCARDAADRSALEAAGRQQPRSLPVEERGTGLAVQPRSPSLPAQASSPPILLEPAVLHAGPEMLREGPRNIPRPPVSKAWGSGTSAPSSRERGKSPRDWLLHAPLLRAPQHPLPSQPA